MSSNYITYYDENILDLEEIEVPQITTDYLKVNNDITVGGKINGIDIVELSNEVAGMDGKFVDLTTNQDVGGVKTFKNMMIYNPVGSVGVIKQEFIGNNAKLSIMSNEDNESSIHLGSNTFSPEAMDVSSKWIIKSKHGMDDGRLLFQAGSFFEGNPSVDMMAFKNVWHRLDHVNFWNQSIEMYQDL